MKNYTSSYQIWNFIEKNPGLNIKPMAYNNVNKRILNLCKNGYLEEINLPNRVNMHGRKDYKVTSKGVEQLIPHIFMHTKEDHQTIIQYLHKFPIEPKQIEDWKNIIVKFHEELAEVTEFYRMQKQTEVIEQKSKAGHDIRITIQKRRDGYDEFDEQRQKQMEQGKPEIADNELTEDLLRKEQSRLKVTSKSKSKPKSTYSSARR
jgi:hypothetical protein